MELTTLRRLGALAAGLLAVMINFSLSPYASAGQSQHAAANATNCAVSSVHGPPGFAMGRAAGCRSSSAPSPRASHGSAAGAPANASYTHMPAPDSSQDLPAGSGPIMPSTTIYYDFWLPTGQHYESTAAGDTNYENLLIQWAQDVGGTQFHNLVTQYYGTNGTISNTVAYGGSWIDTATAYPHAGTTTDPLTDADIHTEVHNAVTTNGWTEDISHIIVVFTGTGIHECNGSSCTFSTPFGVCGYHDHFTDGSNDTVYSFMSFDNFTHISGGTCLPGGTYPNADVNADAEISTLSHEVIEAETDPHPNATWTGPNGEIGDACNYNYTPRNDIGADVYLGGHQYIVQQEWSNAVHTCAIDLAGTNGFCAGSVSSVCAPSTSFAKSVDVSAPRVSSSIHYTVTLNNTNDSGAETNLTLTDNPPSGYTVTAVSAPSATSSSFSSSSVTVAYDTLPVHQSRTVTITATVPLQAGTTATNCGSLAGSDLLGTALSTQTSNPCASTTPVKIPTLLSYTGATTSDYHDQVTVSATLMDDSFNLLSGKTVTFTLNGVETCSASTDLSGSASCPITPGEAAGSFTLDAVFNDSTDPMYATTSTSITFVVTREETTTMYTGPTVILQSGSGVTLTGQLLEDGVTPIAGRTLTLGLGSQTCTTGNTNVAGNASCVLTFTGALGSEALSGSFAGDAYYLPSSDTSQTAIVFAFPSRGAFTLGDLTVGAATPTTTLTWWADNWNVLNSLSGGIAPSSFKGFAAKISLPTSTPPSACGGNWSTLPGNSPPPTSGVPAYMGVLVTTKVTKAGNGVAGNTVHIVVIKVSPGYAPNPSSHGIGTIVAVYC